MSEEKELPPDDDATHMAEAQKIWTPPEPLEVNVQRMAWTLFLECWKSYVNGNWPRNPPVNDDEWEPEKVYGQCLKNAKIVRLCETDAGGS